MLDVQKERHENGEKHLSKTKANTYCNQHLKKKYPFLKEVDKFALTNAIYHLEDGYDRFFKHLSRFPKYKCKHKAKRSYTTNITNGNIEISDNSIKLPKLGWVKAKIHHRPKEDWKLKSATVTQNRDDSYQVSILFAYEESISPAVVTKETTIGLDYKSDGLYVSSEGDTCGMPHYFRQSADKLAKAQRKLRHKTIGSKNYNKQQKRTAKIHRHIANQRKDFLQKKSTEIANQYAIQKEYAVKELKNEIKENLKRKFYKFFFVIKALVTLLLFILFEYLIIAHKMPVDLHYIFLQVTMITALTVIAASFACIVQAIKYQCCVNINKLCTLFAIASLTIFAFSLSGILVFFSSGSIVGSLSSFYNLSYMIIFNLLIFRFFQFKSGKERLRNLGFKVPEEKLGKNVSKRDTL